MDDAELNAIRQARLQELQKNTGQAQQLAPQLQAGAVLAQVLEPSARERLSRVRIVRPDRADAVEQYLVKMIQSGAISRKLGEQDIVEILDGLARDEKKLTLKIVFNRREESDDDDFFD